MVRFQADDGLATGARTLRDNDAVDQVVICTTDTDLFQCIRGTKVVVLDRIRRMTTDEAAFRSRYGIAPWQLPDYLALVGTPAKGPAWRARLGPKTAATMLSHYDSVDQLTPDADDWPPLSRRTRLAATLAAHRDEALMVARLARLRDDLPLDCRLEKLCWRELDDDRLAAVVARAEAHDLSARIEAVAARWTGGRSATRWMRVYLDSLL